MKPCLNPSCSSHGRPHPHCTCYSGGGAEAMYKGGYCSTDRAHTAGCAYYAAGGSVDASNNVQAAPGATAEHYAANHSLLHLLTKVGRSKSENESKHVDDYFDGAKRGHKKLESHVNSLYTDKSPIGGHDPKGVTALKEHLDDLQANPSKILDIGGSLGSSQPDHATQIGAKAATALNYLNSIKPQSQQQSPLDKPVPPSAMETSAYNRQLGVANEPLSVMKHVQNGTVQPNDLVTLRALYPELAQSMTDKAVEQLAKHGAAGKSLTYKQKTGLSALLNQPLDSTMTPQSMQAIIKSQGPQQVANQTTGTKAHAAKATAAELKAIDKVNSLYETPLEARLTEKKSS